MMLRLVTPTLLLLLTGCFANKPPKTVVNAGDSTPIEEREGAVRWEGVPDRTAVVAYEVGHCETDRDCLPRGCDGAVCSPEQMPLTCMTSAVGRCLATVGVSDCGCNEGVCRWVRSPRVLECAAVATERPGTRPFRGSEGAPYPNPPGY